MIRAQPRIGRIRSPKSLASVSMAPPAGKGTIMVGACVGWFSAGDVLLPRGARQATTSAAKALRLGLSFP
jgi:hypothetical protein